MERKKDFSVVAQHVSKLMQQNPKNSSSAQLAKIILKDQALSSKLLRPVNSSAYDSFGDEIRTVSRAVAILGMEHVRPLSVGIIMFQHLKDSEQIDALKSNACCFFLSATLTKSLAGFIHGLDPEEVFLVSMFHKLGRQISIYYLPDEYEEILKQIRHKSLRENKATKHILSMCFVELGKTVANK